MTLVECNEIRCVPHGIKQIKKGCSESLQPFDYGFTEIERSIEYLLRF